MTTTTCSFCGKGSNEVPRLVAGRSATICSECIDLCKEMLAEDGTDRPQLSPDAFLLDVRRNLEDRSIPKESIDRVVEKTRQRQQDPDAIARAVADRETHACSFCGALRKDVPKMITGPRGFICNSCVATTEPTAPGPS